MSNQPTLAVGTYPALCGGYVTEFTANGVKYTAKCSRGVRGLNIKDIVTVTDEGATSDKLGPIKSVSALVELPVKLGASNRLKDTQ